MDALPAGGTERQIVELLKGFHKCKKLQFGLCILKPGGDREKEALRYSHFRLPVCQRFIGDLRPFNKLIKRALRYRVTLIHTFGARSDWIGLFAAKILKVPLINGSIRSARPKLNRIDIASRLSMPWANWIIANSRAGLTAFGLKNSKKASVIYNGIDNKRFVDWADVPVRITNLCMVANFSRKKDQASLIRALPLICKEIPNVRLSLVGRGTKRLTECKQLVKRLGLNDLVDYFENANTPESIIADCGIGVLISTLGVHGEGTSNAILEYMALGKPVVATDCGGNREVISDGKNGFLIHDNSPRSIAEALLKLLKYPEKAKKMGEQGKKRVVTHFGIEKMLHSYEIIYSRILSGYKDGLL